MVWPRFAGLVLGRQLPALIVGLGAAAVLVLGGLAVMDRWYDAVAIFEVPSPGDSTYADHVMDLRLRTPDGRVLNV